MACTIHLLGAAILPMTAGELINKHKIVRYCGECYKRNIEGDMRKEKSRAPTLDNVVRRGIPEKV